MRLRRSSMARVPSMSTIFAAYTTFTATKNLLRVVLRELRSLNLEFVPASLGAEISNRLAFLFSSTNHRTMKISIQRLDPGNYLANELFGAAESYLATKLNPSNHNLTACKSSRDAAISITVGQGEMIADEFDGIKVVWKLVIPPLTGRGDNSASGGDEAAATLDYNKRILRLSFDKQFKDQVIGFYLPHVLARGKEIEVAKRKLKLHTLGSLGFDTRSSGLWRSIDFVHPSTFDTLALDAGMKETLIADLDMFVGRKKFYKRVGKAWKRGYLLYGPPGTGKSSLIAAMANYLKYDVYDLQLGKVNDPQVSLNSLLIATSSRSILVFEDIDCSIKLTNRAANTKAGKKHDDVSSSSKTKHEVTLSDLLNFIDGLWSSCRDERIIVFTTNFKERLDPALLRPGRMDMHIHMSYLTPCGFRTLANNYLGLNEHCLFGEIDEMLGQAEATPAEVAEELIKGTDADAVLQGVVEFLRGKVKRTMMKKQKAPKRGSKELAIEEEKDVENGDEQVITTTPVVKRKRFTRRS